MGLVCGGDDVAEGGRAGGGGRGCDAREEAGEVLYLVEWCGVFGVAGEAGGVCGPVFEGEELELGSGGVGGGDDGADLLPGVGLGAVLVHHGERVTGEGSDTAESGGELGAEVGVEGGDGGLSVLVERGGGGGLGGSDGGLLCGVEGKDAEGGTLLAGEGLEAHVRVEVEGRVGCTEARDERPDARDLEGAEVCFIVAGGGGGLFLWWEGLPALLPAGGPVSGGFGLAGAVEAEAGAAEVMKGCCSISRRRSASLM